MKVCSADVRWMMLVVRKLLRMTMMRRSLTSSRVECLVSVKSTENENLILLLTNKNYGLYKILRYLYLPDERRYMIDTPIPRMSMMLKRSQGRRHTNHLEYFSVGNKM